MNSIRECISLQFGNYSNFIGTHFWNLQEASFSYDLNNQKPLEICHDILFREGLNLKGDVTYTPRLLCVDLKDSFYQLQDIHKGLYDIDSNTVCNEDLCTKEIATIKNEPIIPNEFLTDLAEEEKCTKDENDKKINTSKKFYNLDTIVKVWSDYLKVRFHPRTITGLTQYKHNDSINTFDNFAQGLALWDLYDMKETWVNNLRLFAEECDYLQGFQVTMDSLNGFGGLASKALEYLNEEYSNKCVISMPVMSSNQIDNKKNPDLYAVNSSLLFSSLIESSNIFIPLSTSYDGWARGTNHLNLEYNCYKNELDYHTSAILASAIDTFTLGYRNRFDCNSMKNLSTKLSPIGRKAISASIQMPLGFNYKSNLLDYLQDIKVPLWKPVSPNCSTDMSVAQLMVLRGINKHLLYSSNLVRESKNPSHHCNSASEMLKLYLSFCDQSVRCTEVLGFESPLETIAPFPNIFSKLINQDGFLTQIARPSSSVVEKCTAISGLHNSNSMGDMLAKLNRDSSKVKGSKLSQMFNYNIDIVDFNDCLERLLVLSDNYSTNDCL
ncbi:protein misato [Daktulosphaira vitifoliae]|uniref:protein misato n=1 Tax=Daktulosphaira vitifoliae TaxID=58002 RepID=UPI0021A97E3B|nr:protein misato [Daktulosphaira vitifoliae]